MQPEHFLRIEADFEKLWKRLKRYLEDMRNNDYEKWNRGYCKENVYRKWNRGFNNNWNNDYEKWNSNYNNYYGPYYQGWRGYKGYGRENVYNKWNRRLKKTSHS